MILGSGVAACAAAVFGATEGLSILLLVRKGSLGVDASRTHLHSHESVAEAKTFGVEVLVGDDPVGVRVEGRHRVLSLDSGQDLVAHAILIASEISVRNLPVPGADRLLGFGVRYGDDLTESMPFEDAEVFVVGGANAAVQAAFLFARCARQVTLLVRGESVTGLSSQTSASRLQLAPNIEVQLRTEVRECLGTEKLTGLLLRSNVTWEEWTVAADALYVLIGAEPLTGWLQGRVGLDERGFIRVGSDALDRNTGWKLDRRPMLLETGMPGVFAAGDIVSGNSHQLAGNVGQGSIAVQLIQEYLREVRA